MNRILRDRRAAQWPSLYTEGALLPELVGYESNRCQNLRHDISMRAAFFPGFPTGAPHPRRDHAPARFQFR